MLSIRIGQLRGCGVFLKLSGKRPRRRGRVFMAGIGGVQVSSLQTIVKPARIRLIDDLTSSRGWRGRRAGGA